MDLRGGRVLRKLDTELSSDSQRIQHHPRKCLTAEHSLRIPLGELCSETEETGDCHRGTHAGEEYPNAAYIKEHSASRGCRGGGVRGILRKKARTKQQQPA